MNPVFADTFYFLAIINPNDRAHEAALAFSERPDIPLLTTGWVLVELADAMSRVSDRYLFKRLHEDLRANRESIIVEPNKAWFDAGLELYNKRGDKSWSLTDCISFAVMEEYGIMEALTGDHHFEQAGFRALLTIQGRGF